MLVGPLSSSLVSEYGSTSLQGFMMGYTQLLSGLAAISSTALAHLIVGTQANIDLQGQFYHFICAFSVIGGLAAIFGLIAILIKSKKPDITIHA